MWIRAHWPFTAGPCVWFFCKMGQATVWRGGSTPSTDGNRGAMPPRALCCLLAAVPSSCVCLRVAHEDLSSFATQRMETLRVRSQPASLRLHAPHPPCQHVAPWPFPPCPLASHTLLGSPPCSLSKDPHPFQRSNKHSQV